MSAAGGLWIPAFAGMTDGEGCIPVTVERVEIPW